MLNLYRSFEREPESQLRELCKSVVVPIIDDLTRDDLLGYLKDVALWIWLPIDAFLDCSLHSVKLLPGSCERAR